MNRKTPWILISAAALVWSAASHAVTIDNMTTATRLFTDSFEGAPEVAHGNHPASFEDANPVAQTGSWQIQDDVPWNSQVTDSVTPPDPGAFNGSNYLRIFRGVGGAGTQLYATPTSAVSTPGDVVRAAFRLYLPSGTDANARSQIALVSAFDFDNPRAWVRGDGSGNVIAVGPGFALTDTGLDYTPDTWQEWVLTYAIGSSTFNVSVGGQNAFGLSSFSSGNVTALGFLNGNNTTAGLFFVDIPEPATAALVCLGGLTFLARRRTS
jgi:hypothetical protein